MPGHRVNAQRVHMTAHLMRGDVEEAAVAQRRAELVLLQDGQHIRYPGTTARTEMHVYAVLQDLGALKEVTERLAQIARTYPNWSVYADVGRLSLSADSRRFSGRARGSETRARRRTAEAPGMAQRSRPLTCRVSLPSAAPKKRCAWGEYMDVCRREDLLPGLWQVSQAMAIAAARRGPRRAKQRRWWIG